MFWPVLRSTWTDPCAKVRTTLPGCGAVRLIEASKPLEPAVEVFDGEAHAGSAEVQAATSRCAARYAPIVRLSLDSLAVASNLLGHWPGSSQEQFAGFPELTLAWKSPSLAGLRLVSTRPCWRLLSQGRGPTGQAGHSRSTGSSTPFLAGRFEAQAPLRAPACQDWCRLHSAPPSCADLSYGICP